MSMESKDLYNKSDYDLTQIIKSNDVEARRALDILFERHSGVFALKVNGMSQNSFFGSGVYYIDDLWDDRNYIFYLACKDFDPEISNFCTHLANITWYHAKNIVNRAEKYKYNCDSMEDKKDLCESGCSGFFGDFSNKEFFNEALRYLKTQKDNRYYDFVFQNFVNGKTLEEIGQEHGLTRERVRQIIFSAQKRIRKYFTENTYDLA